MKEGDGLAGKVEQFNLSKEEYERAKFILDHGPCKPAHKDGVPSGKPDKYGRPMFCRACWHWYRVQEVTTLPLASFPSEAPSRPYQR
jgi:hypothetical protein